MRKYDFSGWATRNNLECSDGRTILQDAFKNNDGQIVPLVWNHQHNESANVLGHALLENRPEGVYTYGTFNDTESGRNAKLLVEHGDVVALSIYANRLKQNGKNVLHGEIREVSLVLAGANPGAYIDSVITHGDTSGEDAVIYTGENIEIFHSDDEEKEEQEEVVVEEEEKDVTNEVEEEEVNMDENKEMQHADTEKDMREIFNTLTEEQKMVVYALVGKALKSKKDDVKEVKVEKEEIIEEGDTKMKHNVFDQDERRDDYISHAEFAEIISDAKRYGSMKDAFLAHGIDQIDTLYPYPVDENGYTVDGKPVTPTPMWISRDMGWVDKVMNGVHHTPFSRIKSMFADITGEDARAKGYMKGKLKKEQVFALLKRSTGPTTVYKKQKLDRDDIIDITDFDVIAWLKAEMRMMLNEELARAFLIGDGRDASSDDKIDEQNIRPIMLDDDFYSIKATVNGGTAKEFIKTARKARKNYKGSGSPVLFTTEDVLTDLLLMEDKLTGRFVYDSVEQLKNVLRVSDIVTVPVMEGVKGKGGGDLMGIIVNLKDYNVGADKGGAVNMFDDFDIDYNAQKYLIETRCSGALIRPYSAIVLEAGGDAPESE